MQRKTIFVIGAGASKEVNLPTGTELKNELSHRLNMEFDWDKLTKGDYAIYNALKMHAKDYNNGEIAPYVEAAHLISRAMPQAISIDNYIDAHKDNDKIAICAKLAIIRSILDSENKSLLYFDNNKYNSHINFNFLSSTWYIPFFQLLTENCQKVDLKKRFQSIALVVFNYDRCIEHFLIHSIQNYYNISLNEAADIIYELDIFHPYGCAGYLPWSKNGNAVEFGTAIGGSKLLECANAIKTFTEGTDPNSSEIASIRKHIAYAKKLIFLGFAFHKLNMELISPAHIKPPQNIQTMCYASTYNISAQDQLIVRDQINNMCGFRNSTLEMESVTCCELFNTFWRSLSF